MCACDDMNRKRHVLKDHSKLEWYSCVSVTGVATQPDRQAIEMRERERRENGFRYVTGRPPSACNGTRWPTIRVARLRVSGCTWQHGTFFYLSILSSIASLRSRTCSNIFFPYAGRSTVSNRPFYSVENGRFFVFFFPGPSWSFGRNKDRIQNGGEPTKY